MKKAMLLVMGVVMAALMFSAPARAVEPMGAGVLALIMIGSNVVTDLAAKGKIPAAPPVCRMEKVQAANANYFYEVVAKDNPSNCR